MISKPPVESSAQNGGNYQVDQQMFNSDWYPKHSKLEQLNGVVLEVLITYEGSGSIMSRV